MFIFDLEIQSQQIKRLTTHNIEANALYIAMTIYFIVLLTVTLCSQIKTFFLPAGVTIGGLVVTGGETVEPNRMMDINKTKQNKKQQQQNIFS